jgi:DNA-binding IclR family transcriptional regulator
MANQSTPEKLVGALSSGLSVLRYLAATATPVGVTRIARDLELNSSTCFNLLKTLVHERLVVFDESAKTYTIGLGLVELAKGSLEQASYARLVQPHLAELAMRHRTTATLWQRTSGERVVLVASADSAGAMHVHMSIGQRLPMYLAALGRSIAAASGLTASELRSRFSTMRWENAPSFETWLAEIEEVKVKGYAVDMDHYARGVTTVSAAILDRDKSPAMAISAVGFSGQFDAASIEILGADLRDRAAEISRAVSGLQSARPAASA